MLRAIVFLMMQWLLSGCVSQLYKPGAPENPLNRLALGQSYGDMVRIMGEPDHGTSEDRMGIETLLLFIPVWGFVEWIGDFNPSMMQIYRYDQWGVVTVDNNHIIRVEAK